MERVSWEGETQLYTSLHPAHPRIRLDTWYLRSAYSDFGSGVAVVVSTSRASVSFSDRTRTLTGSLSQNPGWTPPASSAITMDSMPAASSADCASSASCRFRNVLTTTRLDSESPIQRS